MRIREKLGISREMQSTFTRIMQAMLVLMAASGIYTGNLKVTINSTIALLITFSPGLLERKYGVVLDSALALWITLAVFLHAIGTTTLIGKGLYGTISWWDHLTHALSASVVSAAGYITIRALDEHSDELHFPSRLMFVFILVFILAFGVIWELIEFGISGLAEMIGGETILTQYGMEDTMKDLLFNTGGGIMVAVFGEIYLGDTVNQLTLKLQEVYNSEE